MNQNNLKKKDDKWDNPPNPIDFNAKFGTEGKREASLIDFDLAVPEQGFYFILEILKTLQTKK